MGESPPAPPSRSFQDSILVPIGVAVILGLIAFRCLVMISPDPSFDLDPMMEPARWFGLGPGGSAFSSILLLFAGTLVLLGERWSGRGLDRGLLLLWVVPLIAIVLHGRSDATSFWIGLDWFAAALGAVALAHGCRAPGVRSLVLSGFLAVLSMLVVRGAVQLLIEHRETVEFFSANREAMLRSFGWDPGSTQAALYERRLLQPEATGWFGLSNLFSGLMAIGLVLGLVSLLVSGSRVAGGVRVLLYACVLGGFLSLMICNGSKAAFGAAGLGLLVALVPLAAPAWRSRGVRLGGVLAVCALFGTVSVVVIRGLLGPEALGGELSLLFRWHYLVGALAIIAEHPWLGVGPDGFQSAYLFVRPVLSPEEPSSPHDVLLEWLVSFGIFGSFWICLLLVLAFRSGAAAFIGGFVTPRQSLLFVLALATAAYAGMMFELPTLTPTLMLFRLVGLALAFMVFYAARSVFNSLPGSTVPWIMAAGCATLLSLSVLDMLFVRSGSVAIAWGLLGAFSVARPGGLAERSPASGLLAACMPVLCALALFIACVRPQMEVDRRMEAAAEPLRASAGFLLEIERLPRSLTPISRMEALDAVLSRSRGFMNEGELSLSTISELAPGSNDPTLIARALLRREAPRLRREAIERLLACWDLHPLHHAPAWASIEQLRLLANEPGLESGAASAILLEALARTQRLAASSDPTRAAITAAWIEEESASIDPSASWEDVASAFRNALARHPGDPRLHAGLVEALHRGADRQAEEAALERALEFDRLKRLDPLVQYPSAQRELFERRLEALRQSSK